MAKILLFRAIMIEFKRNVHEAQLPKDAVLSACDVRCLRLDQVNVAINLDRHNDACRSPAIVPVHEGC